LLKTKNTPNVSFKKKKKCFCNYITLSHTHKIWHGVSYVSIGINLQKKKNNNKQKPKIKLERIFIYKATQSHFVYCLFITSHSNHTVTPVK
jgi:hypothetical protein